MGIRFGTMSLVSEQIVRFPLIFCVLVGSSWNASVIFLNSLVLCTLIINILIYGCINLSIPTYITLHMTRGTFLNR